MLTLGPHSPRVSGPRSSEISEFERMQAFKTRTFEKLRNVRCPKHHQPPRVRFFGASLREVTISMSGCCQHLIEIANRVIAS